MSYTNQTFAPVESMVDELVRSGLRYAVTSPGSRNAPIALTLARDSRLTALSVLDERSAGFFALGIAKQTGLPVAVTCTSGTAAANLHPAVVEAHEAQVPLVVLTADRPPELREVGAGQSIDQIKLYGSAAKWFVEVGNHPPTRDSAVHLRGLACRAYECAQAPPRGPVHLNFALREPLAPVPEPVDEEVWRGRADGAPWLARHGGELEASAEGLRRLASDLRDCERGAIVCGETSEPIAVEVCRLAELLGWPVLCEPTSQLRCGDHDRSHLIAHYDALLRAEAFAQDRTCELVLRVGQTPTSKALRQWLKRARRQIVIDPANRWHEPTRTAELFIGASAQSVLRRLFAELDDTEPRLPGWLAGWRDADERVGEALSKCTEPFEPAVYHALTEAVPAGATVWLSSSMPVRDCETFLPLTSKPVRLFANRGANGIDGVVSAALGAAVASARPAFLITGELALLHDIGGLLSARRHGIDLRIVCINNQGGGIFDYLPVAAHAEPGLYEEHVLCPAPVSLKHVATTFELSHKRIEYASQLAGALSEASLIELCVDRDHSQRERARLFDRVEALVAPRRCGAI